MQISHDPESGLFTASPSPGTAVGELAYRVDNETMVILHTGVRPEFEGKGIAAQLVQAAIDWATAQHLRVRPVCSYARLWMARHPETQSLLAG